MEDQEQGEPPSEEEEEDPLVDYYNMLLEKKHNLKQRVEELKLENTNARQEYDYYINVLRQQESQFKDITNRVAKFYDNIRDINQAFQLVADIDNNSDGSTSPINLTSCDRSPDDTDKNSDHLRAYRGANLVTPDLSAIEEESVSDNSLSSIKSLSVKLKKIPEDVMSRHLERFEKRQISTSFQSKDCSMKIDDEGSIPGCSWMSTPKEKKVKTMFLLGLEPSYARHSSTAEPSPLLGKTQHNNSSTNTDIVNSFNISHSRQPNSPRSSVDRIDEEGESPRRNLVTIRKRTNSNNTRVTEVREDSTEEARSSLRNVVVKQESLNNNGVTVRSRTRFAAGDGSHVTKGSPVSRPRRRKAPQSGFFKEPSIKRKMRKS